MCPKDVSVLQKLGPWRRINLDGRRRRRYRVEQVDYGAFLEMSGDSCLPETPWVTDSAQFRGFPRVLEHF